MKYLKIQKGRAVPPPREQKSKYEVIGAERMKHGDYVHFPCKEIKERRVHQSRIVTFLGRRFRNSPLRFYVRMEPEGLGIYCVNRTAGQPKKGIKKKKS